MSKEKLEVGDHVILSEWGRDQLFRNGFGSHVERYKFYTAVVERRSSEHPDNLHVRWRSDLALFSYPEEWLLFVRDIP